MFSNPQVRRAALRQFTVLFCLCLALAIGSQDSSGPSLPPQCATNPDVLADPLRSCPR